MLRPALNRRPTPKGDGREGRAEGGAERDGREFPRRKVR